MLLDITTKTDMRDDDPSLEGQQSPQFCSELISCLDKLSIHETSKKDILDLEYDGISKVSSNHNDHVKQSQDEDEEEEEEEETERGDELNAASSSEAESVTVTDDHHGKKTENAKEKKTENAKEKEEEEEGKESVSAPSLKCDDGSKSDDEESEEKGLDLEEETTADDSVSLKEKKAISGQDEKKSGEEEETDSGEENTHKSRNIDEEEKKLGDEKHAKEDDDKKEENEFDEDNECQNEGTLSEASSLMKEKKTKKLLERGPIRRKMQSELQYPPYFKEQPSHSNHQFVNTQPLDPGLYYSHMVQNGDGVYLNTGITSTEGSFGTSLTHPQWKPLTPPSSLQDESESRYSLVLVEESPTPSCVRPTPSPCPPLSLGETLEVVEKLRREECSNNEFGVEELFNSLTTNGPGQMEGNVVYQNGVYQNGHYNNIQLNSNLQSQIEYYNEYLTHLPPVSEQPPIDFLAPPETGRLSSPVLPERLVTGNAPEQMQEATLMTTQELVMVFPPALPEQMADASVQVQQTTQQPIISVMCEDELAETNVEEQIQSCIDNSQLEEARMKMALQTNEDLTNKDYDGDNPCAIVACQKENSDKFYENLVAMVERVRTINICCEQPIPVVNTGKMKTCLVCGNTNKNSFYSPFAMLNNDGDNLLSCVLKAKQSPLVVRYICENIAHCQSDVNQVFSGQNADVYRICQQAYPILGKLMSSYQQLGMTTFV